MIPTLPHNCNSWTVVSRQTGEPVLETFSPSVAGKINLNSYFVVTTLQWLQGFNQSLTHA